MTDPLSTGQPTDWRPDERALFDNRFARWGRRWMLVGVAALAVGVGLGLSMETPVLGILIGCLGGTLGLIFGFAFWLTGGGIAGQFETIRAGGYLARWSIDHERWWDWHRAQRNVLARATLLTVGFLSLVGYGVAAMIYADGDTEPALWTVAISTAAIPLILLVMRAHRAPAPPPSMRSMPFVIGTHGALTIGAYLQWRGFGMRLLGAAVEPDPPTLEIRFDVRAKHGTVDHTLRLPVPADRIDEARGVAARLNEQLDG